MAGVQRLPLVFYACFSHQPASFLSPYFLYVYFRQNNVKCIYSNQYNFFPHGKYEQTILWDKISVYQQ